MVKWIEFKKNINKITLFYDGLSLVIRHWLHLCFCFFESENDVGRCQIISEYCLFSKQVNFGEGKRCICVIRKTCSTSCTTFCPYCFKSHTSLYQCKLYCIDFWSLMWCCMKHKWPYGSIRLSASEFSDKTWFGSSVNRFDVRIYTAFLCY